MNKKVESEYLKVQIANTPSYPGYFFYLVRVLALSDDRDVRSLANWYTKYSIKE